jgi:hypothetical protein
MKTLRRNRATLAGVFTLAGLALCAVYACVSAWGQTAPGLSLAVTGSNVVTLTVTNSSSNSFYQIYYREFLSSDYPWYYLTNGSVNQSNFQFSMGDTSSGFFQAGYNPSFVTPTITVIIQSPTNGALIY